MSFRLVGLGELSLYDAERRKTAVPRKALGLMAVLAASAPKSVPRERLIALLWPESGEQGRGALKQTIYELRQTLGAPDPIVGVAELSLDPALVTCDFTELEAAHAAGDWQRVIDLHAGPFLEGFHVRDSAEFDHWADARRAHYATLFQQAVEKGATLATARGDLAGAVALWRRLAAHDPLGSRATLALLDALAAAGETAAALTHYQLHKRLLQEQLGVPPDPEVTAAAERIRARVVSAKPAADVAPTADTEQAPPDAAVPAAPPSRRQKRWTWVAASTAALALVAFVARDLARPSVRVLGSVSVPEHANLRVTVDPHMDRVYVDGGASFEAALSVIDTRTRVTRLLPQGAGVAIDPLTHWYWTGDYRARAVVVRNGRSDEEIGRVTVPGCPYAFAMAGERVWVAQQCDDHISVIDSRERRVIRNIPVPTLSRAEVGGAKGMGEIFVNRNTGIAYFTKDGIPHRVDPRDWQLRETPTFDGPVILVNEVTNRLYVKVDRGLRVIDGATEKLIAQVELPSTPGRAAVGFGGSRVYVTTGEGLVALDGATHRVLFVRSLGEGFAPDGVAVDVVRNRAWVVGNDASGARTLKIVALAD